MQWHDDEVGFGTQIRKSPFFDATLKSGAKEFSVYNHMYIPRDFGVSTISNLLCYQSDLTPKGAEYTSVWALPFQKGNRRSSRNSERPSRSREPQHNDKGEAR